MQVHYSEIFLTIEICVREIFRDKAIAERIRGNLLSLVDKEPSSALASMLM